LPDQITCLGLGGSNHDYAACIVRDGKVAVAIEEERLSGNKYAVGDNSLFLRSRKYCLSSLEIDLDQVDTIVADDTLMPGAYFPFRERIRLINHHLAHACSAFYPSGFESAALLIVDGAGSLIEGRDAVETLTYAQGSGNDIAVIGKVLGGNWVSDGLSARRVYQAGESDNSLGFLYSAVSRALGFSVVGNADYAITEDGKTMGLAPYGTERYCKALLEFVQFGENGTFSINMRNDGVVAFAQSVMAGKTGDAWLEPAADLAYAVQHVLEEALVHCAEHLFEATREENLCLAGGVALNCVANGKLLGRTPFKRYFIQPAAGDAGNAIGCALYGYYRIQGQPRSSPRDVKLTTAYLGSAYSDAQIEAALVATATPYRRLDSAAKTAAAAISRGCIIGWFQGGSEFGPRALGHRSMLADARDRDMRDTINHRIKRREWFRPFAPAVLEEHASEFFALDQESPFMLLAVDVREDKRDIIPSVVHVDGTARVQTVSKANGEFRELLEAFHDLTGVPVVLNTSLNGRGQPIVETPEMAVGLLKDLDIDALFVGPFVATKTEDRLAEFQ